MPRRTLTTSLLLIVALTVLMPRKAVAGPPEGVSGRMVFDEVADGLRRCRKEKDLTKRLGLLKKLALTHDPRVAVFLLDTLPAGSTILTEEVFLLANCFIAGTRFHVGNNIRFDEWKEANEADLRSRAKQLPQ
jgi:hypothetical protein